MVTTRALLPSISPEALMGKSKAFIARGLAEKATGSLSDYQLWASLALELLAKASLATIHPSLIVDTHKNQNAVLISAGKDATKGLRGHSSLFAAMDAAVEVSRDGDRREWRVAKSKDGQDGDAQSPEITAR